MKLNKNTRDAVIVGTILYSDVAKYEVVTVIETRYGKQITVRCDDGRYIYAMPLSSYYGLNIKIA